jgi:hypothetical protein
VACVVLSAIGLAVALLLLGPRRDGAAETPEAQPAAAGD